MLDIVSISYFHLISFTDQLTAFLRFLPSRHITALNSAYQPHPHHPASTTSPTMPPFPHSSIPFDPGYRAYDPPSIQHDIQLPSQVPYPSSDLPYHPHRGPPAHPQVLPPSAGLSMHKLCQASPVPAVPHMRTWASFQARLPIIDALHCSSSAPYNETELYRLPSFEPESIHWNSPPTSSGLPLTPSDDNTVAPQLPQLPYFSQLPLSKSPPQQPYVVPVSVLPFSPAHTHNVNVNGPAFPTGKLEPLLADTQAASQSSLNQGTKDVFQSLKRKRLPVAASFSRPKPRMLPVKKVLPKIHGCQTCGKMFDRPSTLLVVSVMMPCFKLFVVGSGGADHSTMHHATTLQTSTPPQHQASHTKAKGQPNTLSHLI